MLESIKQWIAKPFDAEMSLARWALFTGLILVLVILWNMVLRDLKGAQV